MSSAERFECRPDSDDPSDRRLAAVGEVHGVTFSRRREFDLSSGIMTQWTYRGNDAYYAREDYDPSGMLERSIWDDQDKDRRSNTITEKRGDNLVLVSYSGSSLSTGAIDKFDLSLGAVQEERKVEFISSYSSDGTLRGLGIMSAKNEESVIEAIPNSLPEEARLDKKLKEIVALYQAKGRAAFVPVLAREGLEERVSLEGRLPELVLDSDLRKSGYTDEDIRVVQELAAIPVTDHDERAGLLGDLQTLDRAVMYSFLVAVTAATLVPAVAHKDNRNILLRYEDIDEATPEGYHQLSCQYELALNRFIKNHNEYVDLLGTQYVVFEPFPGEQGKYAHSARPNGMANQEWAYEGLVSDNKEVRYGRKTYRVSEAGDKINVFVHDIFAINKDDHECVVTAPLTLDTGALQEAMDAEDSSWRDSFQHAPISFKIP